MATFTDVPIGTSDPVNICLGLPLLPKLGTTRAGIQSGQHSDLFFDLSSTVLFSRFKLSAYYEFLMGLCGPSVAFLLEDVDVTTVNTGTGGGQVTLDLSRSRQDMEAGLFLGFVFGGGIHVVEQLYLPSSWYSPWKFKWKTVFDAQIGVEIDFVELFSALIAYVLEEGGQTGLWSEESTNPLGKVIEQKGKTFQFLGDTNDTLPAQTSLTASPTLNIPINLVDYVPPLASFVKLLHTIKGELAFGPTFGIAMPVTLSMDSLAVDGVKYGSLAYDAQSIVATGPAFTTTPKQLTANVRYDVGFELDLAVYFSISACKVFNFSFQALSLDLLNLLGLPAIPTVSVSNSVSTELEAQACVLVPELTLTFDQDPVLTASPVTGTVSLGPEYVGPLTVSLTTDPTQPNFPSQVLIPSGATAASFHYTFANRCIPTGDPANPTATQSPSPTSPTATVNVTATATVTPPPCGSGRLEATTALKVQSRVISLTRLSGTRGSAPVWADQSTGGVIINADPTLPAGETAASNTAIISLEFPGSPQLIPVTFTLLDETRREHTTSVVELFFEQDGGASIVLGPATTRTISISNRIDLLWASKGPPAGYSNRFILVVDAGCALGQTEFWLDVWNWS